MLFRSSQPTGDEHRMIIGNTTQMANYDYRLTAFTPGNLTATSEKCCPTIRKLRKTLQNGSDSGLTTEILPSTRKHFC